MLLFMTMKQAHVMRILHSVIHTMRAGSTVNAAVVAIPPNMPVADRPGAPELTPISAVGRTITSAHSPTMKTSRKFRLSFSKACVSYVAVQAVSFGDPIGNHARLHNGQHRNKAET
jgi:hypothetical protein